MQKKFLSFAVALFAVLLVLFAHLGARLTASAPVFSLAEEKRIYLTFDDGPSTVVTESILDTLAKEQIKATFFVVGERIFGREETLRRIVKEGHTVGVHSYTHRYREIYASDEALLADAEACAKLIRKTTGVVPAVYRLPGGGEHPSAAALLRQKGYRIVLWNAVCGDEEIKNADAATLLQTALQTAKGKEPVVLLLHDSAPHRATAAALPAIIERFRQAGYVFCAF